MEETPESQVSESQTLYNFTVDFYKKNFHGQSATTSFERKVFAINSFDEFVDEMWDLVNTHIQREIVWKTFDDGTVGFAFSPKTFPEKQDLCRYVVMQLPWNKHNLRFEQLTNKVFQSWRGKDIKGIIYVHGSAIRRKHDYLTVQSTLLDTVPQDRAGGPNNQAKNQMADDLFELNKDIFEASRTAYLCWAAYILTKPSEQRESLINGLPPADYSHLFHPIPPPAGVVLQAHREGLSMARTINNGFKRDLDRLQDQFDVCVRHLEMLGQQIKELRLRESVQEEFIAASESSLVVAEVPFSHEAATEVTEAADLLDYQHM